MLIRRGAGSADLSVRPTSAEAAPRLRRLLLDCKRPPIRLAWHTLLGS